MFRSQGGSRSSLTVKVPVEREQQQGTLHQTGSRCRGLRPSRAHFERLLNDGDEMPIC